MRVCCLNPQGYVEAQPPLGRTDTGGQVVYVLELARALARQGVQVDLVTRQFGKRPLIEDLGHGARIVRIPCGSNRFVVKEKLYALLPDMVKGLKSFMAETGVEYDVIHSHYWDGGYAGLLLQRQLKLPHVFTPHSLGKWKEQALTINGAADATLDRLYRYEQRIAVERRVMRAADEVLMISQNQRVKLMGNYKVDFDKIRVLYPGVDVDIFRPARRSDKSNAILPTTNNILLVSRFVPAKGIDRAIDVLNLIGRDVDCHLYIVTANDSASFSEEERANETLVRERIRQYGLDDRVTFLGYVSDRARLAEYYRATDIFLQPARYEPFGLTTMEAMACGAVVAVSDVAGSCELLIDGVNGFIVDLRKRQAVADLLVELFQQKRLRKRISENAVMTVEKHLSWNVIARKMIDQIYTAKSALRLMD